MRCISNTPTPGSSLNHMQANVLPPAKHPKLGRLDYFSVALFAGSWLFEIGTSTAPHYYHNRFTTSRTVADSQKSAWRHAKDKKEHDEKFITKGLWGISRHPKYVSSPSPSNIVPRMAKVDRCPVSYVGEVGLWTGLWLLSVNALRTPLFPRGAWLIAGASPLLTWYLLSRVSGVPPLEVRIVALTLLSLINGGAEFPHSVSGLGTRSTATILNGRNTRGKHSCFASLPGVDPWSLPP